MTDVLARRRAALLVAGTIATVALALGAIFDTAGAANGLLFAFLVWLAIPIGSAVLMEIHTLTGGAWGRALRPVLADCAATVPVFIVPFVFIVLGARTVYPWAADASATKWRDVSAGYLNVQGFALRALVIWAVWCLIAAAPRPRRAERLWAGIGLALYGITISIAAVDWSMSLSPKWASTSFAAITAIGQITAALAFAALLQTLASRAETEDVAGLILACLLGYAYLSFMQYLVIWSGNLPDRVNWYVARVHHGWALIEGLAILAGAAAFLILIRRKARQSGRATPAAAVLVLAALLLDRLWQTVPSLPEARPWAVILATVALGCLWIGLAGRVAWLPRQEALGRV
ncbi:MAG: hypothetical protein JOZ40_21735 [Methylobacteriaceae bacterium]|nr:hypothetical protein [Methylobacteriaceae bacterium]